MEPITLRFHTLSQLTTFSQMVNNSFQLDTRELTISGSFPKPYVSIAQTLFDATLQ